MQINAISNPNELLMLAGWPTLKAFDIHTESAEHLPPEAVQVAKEIARIPNPGTRKTVAEAILKAAGSSPDKVVSATFILGDPNYFNG